MALMTTLGNLGSLLAKGRKPLKDERVAIFSDALNHASIIDGIRLAERQGNAEVLVYRHCDMSHLNELLFSCTMKKKVVVTDSMDGDFAPMSELAKLRKRHGFLLVIDDVSLLNLYLPGKKVYLVFSKKLVLLSHLVGLLCTIKRATINLEFFQAHGTFICGKNGGGVAEEFNCESDVDICIGTLSKAAGCHGGFVACR
ncbi:hypothetical protein TEA_013048 [Camellia sinensis var. sinensis]|uniref:Aminotransferase class I/classII large domain-containing protein n=1 Tax=Camellia sinensis var. sinensis TaxID=542762 RepID=A0A4V3WJR2_CAMSN|nr:hypothetical protein TEA_013048 [Camellia sinensis var. sinensis]